MQFNNFRLIIAGDSKMFCEMLSAGLRAAGIAVVATAATRTDLINQIHYVSANALLLDPRMAGAGGYDLVTEVTQEFRHLSVIVLSSYFSQYEITRAIQSGAKAFIDKNSQVAEIVDALNHVGTRGVYFNRILTPQLLQSIANKKKVYYLIGLSRLSQREVDILQDLCRDFTVEQIASKHAISVRTVRFHKQALLKKTSSQSDFSLLRFALRHGISSED